MKGAKLSQEETAIRNKVLYALVTEILADQESNGTEEAPILEVRNTLPSCQPLRFIKITTAKKGAEKIRQSRTAKKRVAPLSKMLEVVAKHDAEQLFLKAPKRIAQKINEVTAAASGTKIESWDPRKLAAIEGKLNLSYRQSQFFRLCIHNKISVSRQYCKVI